MSGVAGITRHGHNVDEFSPADFLLCRNSYHVSASGSERSYSAVAQAADALRSGTVPVIVGALPFDIRDAAALTVPERFDVINRAWVSDSAGTLPAGRIAALHPSLAEHRRRVAATVSLMRRPDSTLHKVVLARGATVRTDTPVRPYDLAASLRKVDPLGSIFVADLSAAGRSSTLVGASPEVLISKRGTVISAHPLAGSAPRSTDPAIDAARGRELGSSVKDHAEHRFVVDAIATALRPLCRTLEVPDEPELMTTPAMWHLGTPIRGEVADPALTALDLALAVHPTPAVCGTPTTAARDHILATEGDRGFYSGAIGWARTGGAGDGGDGEWMVSIRCAEVAADGLGATAWAGGGIVAASDPDAEVAETQAKFATILGAFGISAPASVGVGAPGDAAVAE